MANRDSKDELNSEERTILRGAIGRMRWVCDQTRPDIGFDQLELSMKANKPNVGDVKLMNKVVNHIKNVSCDIKYRKLEGRIWYISTFVDASKGILPDGHSSTMGYLIWLTNGYALGNPGTANI